MNSDYDMRGPDHIGELSLKLEELSRTAAKKFDFNTSL